MFHQDKSQDVRKLVVGFIEEAWYNIIFLKESLVAYSMKLLTALSRI